MLAVAVVLFLAVGVSEGVVLNKCSLKQQLQANLTLPSNAPNMLAQIVCHVQKTSNFNTSAVKTVIETQETVQFKGRKVRVAKVTVSPHLQLTERIWNMYGIFQLSDHVACNSTKVSSLNLCGVPCSKLIDGNLTDDVACLQILINKMTTVIGDPRAAEEIHEMMSILEQPDCFGLKNSVYFSNC